MGVTFENSMLASLRQGPDIISIGEIRSHEMAVIAVQMALTGHLVLSTMHTAQATKGVIRLKDIGVEPFLIADTLTGICSLRLVRKLCPHCREACSLDDPVIKHAGFPEGNYYQAKGCDYCNQTGYHGRTGAFEFFEMTDNCRELFLNGCSPAELREQSIKDGMTTMLMDGMRKAAEGITSPQEVLRVLATT
jgi:general secretion pathway protein E